MPFFQINPSQLKGEITIPPSKSQTIRAITFAMLAKGISKISNPLHSLDTDAMIRAAQLLGAKLQIENGDLLVSGLEGRLSSAEDVIDCGNSGLVLRLMGALSALNSTHTVLTGDYSIRHNRIITPLLEGLNQWGAKGISTRNDGGAPIVIRGPLKGGAATISGIDSQPVSALLIAGAFSPHSALLEVVEPGEKPWVSLTLDWFDRLSIPYQRRGFEMYKLEGGATIDRFEYRVPSDFSALAFPLAAALTTSSEIKIKGLDLKDPQGDKGLISLLQKMGAQIEIDDIKGEIYVKRGGPLKGGLIDVNDWIDALPILAVIATFAEGTTTLVGGAGARKKESNRIGAIYEELKKMGADIEELADGLIIKPTKLRGAHLKSHHDHRIAMALSVAALGAKGESLIEGVECIDKTYPSFHFDFCKLGAEMKKRWS